MVDRAAIGPVAFCATSDASAPAEGGDGPMPER